MSTQERQRSVSLIGRDLARAHPRRRSRAPGFPALLVGALLAGLFLAALRVDILRMSSALEDARVTLESLEREARDLTAEVGALRDPARLAVLAGERGFADATRVLEARGPQARP